MKTSAQSENAAGWRLIPTPEETTFIFHTVVPLAAVLLAIKLGKLFFAFVHIEGAAASARLIYTSWLIRLIVLAVVAIVGAKISPQRWKWRVAASPFIVVVLAKIAQARWVGRRAVTYEWVVDAAKQFHPVYSAVFGAIHMDLAFLGGFTILVYGTVVLAPARAERALRVVLVGSVALLLALSGLELAQYRKTGMTGTGHLLGFFVSNAVGLWPMLRAETDFLSMAMLILPLIAGGAVAFVDWWQKRPGREYGLHLHWMVPVLVMLCLAAGFAHPALVDHRFDRFGENTYLGLRDLVTWRNAGELEAAKRANRLPSLFDTSQAVLVPRVDTPIVPRNVIIIMLESARANSTSIYDASMGTTPFLADFAKRGAVVPEMYAVIPRTSAAWVAVLDGVWPSTDEEMMSWVQRGQPRFRSLAELLAMRGYTTAFFTTANTNFSYDARLIRDLRFDAVYDGNTLPSEGFEKPTSWGYEDRMMLNPSLDWVRVQRDHKRPFLLVMMTTVGHYTYQYPSTWKTRSFGDVDPLYNSYLNCLGYVDSMLKDFVSGLDQLGVLRSSIVIILGDHGESFGEHGPRTHSLELYEETVKIPAIVYAEGLVPPGSSIGGLRQEVDIAPTIFDALVMNSDQAVFSGSSLLKPIPSDRPLYFSGALYSQATAMRTRGIKFIYNFGRIPTEAYDIDRDPNELNDIAPTLPRSAIDEAEMNMLVWRERVSRVYLSPSLSKTPPS